MDKLSYLNHADVSVIENLYQQYQINPESVEITWRKFFEGFEFAQTSNLNLQDSDSSTCNDCEAELVQHNKEVNVINMIGAYRARGHLFTKTNPVRQRRQYSPPLDYTLFNLKESDLDKTFHAGSRIGIPDATLREIIKKLEHTYSRHVGVEYTYIRQPEIVEWLQEKMESCSNQQHFTKEEKLQVFTKLNQAVFFEQFMGRKFVGQKRFSLEGVEGIIPALDTVVEKGSDLGIQEFAIGMAHRGRLNVLGNIMKKPYELILQEFSGSGYSDDAVEEENRFYGDVKYHMGYSSDRLLSNGKTVHLSMPPNPSHLEAVGPVLEGIVHAKMKERYSGDMNKIAPIILHGDASIAGQGVVYELLQMSTLDPYKTGGTIHIVLNNQIGFTTNYLDARSSTYSTDIAKTTRSPVFHVNGDSVESIIYVIQLALEFRQKYHVDVFIDVLGYRKHGHNEGDEPKFTQPTLYKIIEKHPNPLQIYATKLLKEGSISQQEMDSITESFEEELESCLVKSKEIKSESIHSFFEGDWKGIKRADKSSFEFSPKTGVSEKTLYAIAEQITTLPKDKNFYSKTKKLFSDRKKMCEPSGKIDWGTAEALAFGSLLTESFNIRLSGQDVQRGTFSHRHAVITIEDSMEKYIPLEHIKEATGKFYVYNSILSEYAVLGFEFGYSLATPKTLTIWEAQFGDFANGAQIIIDQFVTSSETKWQRMNGLVMLLPHGYEGQGPEHSSARLERYLTACAQNNIQVVNCTTPANFFHLLRRQLHREFRKPLVVMSPKSLLRHPKCKSNWSEFTEGTKFHEVLDDNTIDAKNIRRILLCTGKIYYDLLKYQEENQIKDIAIVRIEQLYPIPHKQLDTIFEKYKDCKEWFWVQEEPKNMGAYSFILRKFPNFHFTVVSRKGSSTTATGFAKQHIKEQQKIVTTAFSYK